MAFMNLDLGDKHRGQFFYALECGFYDGQTPVHRVGVTLVGLVICDDQRARFQGEIKLGLLP